MARACGNRYVRTLYEDLLPVGLRLSRSAFGTALDEPQVDEAYYEDVIAQHHSMIDALARGDADAADKLGRVHTDLFRRRIIRAIETDRGRELDLSQAPE